MTRTTCLSTLSCAAILAALTAYGCGSSSTISNGTGGGGGHITTGAGGGAIIIGVGGGPGTGPGTGGMVGRDAGPPVDAGINRCVAGSQCTTGFTCTATCNVGGNANNPGTRACACNNNNIVNCPGGGGACMPIDAGPLPDAGFNMCVANTPCTQGFTCRMVCNAGGGRAGTRACTCNANNTVNCPGGGGTCIPDDAGTPDAVVRPDAAMSLDAPPG